MVGRCIIWNAIMLSTYPHMYQLLMNQAGSMTNLAGEYVTFLMSNIPFGNATRRPSRSTFLTERQM